MMKAQCVCTFKHLANIVLVLGGEGGEGDSNDICFNHADSKIVYISKL